MKNILKYVGVLTEKWIISAGYLYVFVYSIEKNKSNVLDCPLFMS
jgi:hypothetical protein